VGAATAKEGSRTVQGTPIFPLPGFLSIQKVGANGPLKTGR